MWPNKCAGHTLQDKLENYAGDMGLYSPANKKRQSFFATAAQQDEVVTTCKSRMACTRGGKYREVHVLCAGAMVNSSLPESLTEEAYKLVSMSIRMNTAKTYRSAQSILEPASAWLGKPTNVPFKDSDAIALVVYIAVVSSLRNTTIFYFVLGSLLIPKFVLKIFFTSVFAD